MKSRIFWIMQYEYNPKKSYDVVNGELELRKGESPLITQQDIDSGLNHKSIKKWNYVWHDKDTYSEDDEANDKDGVIKAGMKKPRHCHIALQFQGAVELSTIARWFNVPEQYIDVPKGRGALLDCCEYHTHESEKQQAKGKHLYADSEIISNFDWRTELTERAERNAKFGGDDVSKRDRVRYEVLYEGRTLRDLAVKDPLAYQNDYATLDKLRIKYISNNAPMPDIRINYYVTGKGGIGKGLISRALARSLYPDVEADDDIFFEVGAKGVPFEGYDGQPVIIWNDRRAIDLLQELDGRGNVFNVFDTHPTRGKQNIKYGSVNLINKYNIVNSVEGYETFLDGLAGEYIDKAGQKYNVEDKGQSYRRFPFIIPLHESDFDLLMNKGFYYGTKEYNQYISYQNIRGNMQKIAEICQGNEVLARQIEQKTMAPVKYVHDDLMEKQKEISKKMSDEEILEYFKDYGTQPKQQ